MDKIVPKACPICGVTTNYVYNLDNGKDQCLWYRCNCGVVFQSELPTHGGYNERYISNYADCKEAELVQVHAGKMLAPLVEELTYGRKMLEVGFCLPYNMEFFKRRGWICTGLELNSEYNDTPNVISGDFETIPGFNDEYNVIWMSHVFEHFKDPIGVLKKAHTMLPEDGVMYISTPDIDFINKTGVGNFPHWKKDEHYIMWNEQSLKREVERAGFKVIMCRRNFASRFSAWFDLQLLVQKNFI